MTNRPYQPNPGKKKPKPRDVQPKVIQTATPAETRQFAPTGRAPNHAEVAQHPNHYYRTQHSYKDFNEYCAALTAAFLRDLEIPVQRVVDKLGLEESKRRLSLVKIPHDRDDDMVILETRLILDYVRDLRQPKGTLLGIMFAYVDVATNKVKNRMDWSPDAYSMGLCKRDVQQLDVSPNTDPLAP